ncbi:MAG: AbrB/MazE/SpoVT family DNA-binding domain-containing protein [Actinobacteria bacterium]|nr:AbrB/MazE/SpoVT family DNA-binding domain-containing protein [Actinomycetota bacterium]
MKIRISKGGQVSLPAEIRRRWASNALVVEDLGDRVVLRPIPSDPVGAVVGAFPSQKGTARQARKLISEEEQEAERRKYPK